MAVTHLATVGTAIMPGFLPLPLLLAALNPWPQVFRAAYSSPCAQPPAKHPQVPAVAAAFPAVAAVAVAAVAARADTRH